MESYHNNGQMRSIWQYENGAYVSTECLAYDGLSQLTEDWTTNQGSAGCQAPSTATVSGPAAFWASYRNGIVHIHILKREASKPRRIAIKDSQ